ncbi:MAG: hypothetical protein LBB09_01380 [Rickettsiales bacterium]|nr:hypothetical protein [Rickettsiales bacterium]
MKRRVWERGVTKTKLTGQEFFAKAMTKATGRDGGDVGRMGADRVFGGCLYILSACCDRI